MLSFGKPSSWFLHRLLVRFQNYWWYIRRNCRERLSSRIECLKLMALRCRWYRVRLEVRRTSFRLYRDSNRQRYHGMPVLQIRSLRGIQMNVAYRYARHHFLLMSCT